MKKIPKTIQDTVFEYFSYNRTDRDSTEVVHCDRFTINTLPIQVLVVQPVLPELEETLC